MTSVVYLEPKDINEIVALVWEFSDTAIVASTASVTVVDGTGVDAGASTMPQGSPSIAAGSITQRIQGGIFGITYKVRLVGSLPDGTVFIRVAYLPVTIF